MSGALAGWLDIKVGDFAADGHGSAGGEHAAGIPEPEPALAVGCPGPECLCRWWSGWHTFFLSEKPERAQVYESFSSVCAGDCGRVRRVDRAGVVDIYSPASERSTNAPAGRGDHGAGITARA